MFFNAVISIGWLIIEHVIGGSGVERLTPPAANVSAAAVVHPNHFSTAEVRWNERTGNFEVALCVWPADLEKALAVLAGASVDLDKQQGLNELMEKYITSRFYIRKLIDETVQGNRPVQSPDQPVLSSPPAEPASHQPPNPQRETSDLAPAVSSDTASADPGSPTTQSSTTPAPENLTAGKDKDKDKPTSELEAATARNAQRRTPAIHAHGTPDSNPAADHAAAIRERNHAPRPGNPIRWVGFEANLKEAWLYFEVAGDLEPAQWEIENRVFFEFNEEQVNQIRFTCGKETKSYSLKPTQATWQMETKRDLRSKIQSDQR